MLCVDFISDIHSTFYDINDRMLDLGKTNSHILVIAGDIAHGPETTITTLTDICRNYDYEHILFVAGNHDYYNAEKSTPDYIDEIYKSFFDEHKTIKFLTRNKSYVIDGYRFIGCNGWYSVDNNPSWYTRFNDSRCIGFSDGAMPEDLMDKDYNYLEREIKKSNEKCILVTHTAPFKEQALYKGEYTDVTQFYYNPKLGELASELNLVGWIFGHTHTPTLELKNGIPFVNNPMGYPRENINTGLQSVIIDGRK